MGNLMSAGQLAYEFVRSIYKQKRFIVDAMVTAGKITKEAAQQKWAQEVFKELTKHGLKVSKNILKLL